MEACIEWLRLKTVPGVGNRLFLNLIQHFGEPNRVFSASRKELLRVEGVNDRVVSAIRAHKVPKEVQNDLSLVQKNSFRIITFSDSDYPPLLRHIHDPPPVLYVYGSQAASQHSDGLASSGQCTNMGCRVNTPCHSAYDGEATQT